MSTKLDLFICSIIHKHQHTTASALGSDLILMGDLLFPKQKERRNEFGGVGTEGMGVEEGLGGEEGKETAAWILNK